MRLRRILLGVVLTLALLSLAIYLFSNTRLQVQGSSLDEGSLSLETQFPNATCRKIFTLNFPFIKLKCDVQSP